MRKVKLFINRVFNLKKSWAVAVVLTSRSTMLGLLFLSVLTAWKTSTECWCWSISHTMLMAQNVPLRPPPFLPQPGHRRVCFKLSRVVFLFMFCSKSFQSVGGDVSFFSFKLQDWARWFLLRTYRQWTTVRPSPPSYSSCHLSTCRMSLRKERLDMGVSLYMGQPRNWNCCTIR